MDHTHDVPAAEAPAETSKAGLRRMRRLHAKPPVLRSSPRSAIHPNTSTLIYPAPPSGPVAGYLTSSVFSSSHPTSLPTPSVLTPGDQLSISPDGEWTVVFHPNPSDGGGTLAIYPVTILSPKTTPSNIVPLATFPLVSAPLAITHLYPPRIHLTNKRCPPLGPQPPTSSDSSHGPTFIVLLPSGLMLFHPQAIPPVQLDAQIPITGSPAWTMNVLRCPLKTRWHATAGGNVPGEDGWKVNRGWIGLVPGDHGVWVGWQREDQIGVTRVAIGVDAHGRYYVQTTPMPTLPRVDRPPFTETTQEIRSELQNIVFVHAGGTKSSEEGQNGMQVDTSSAVSASDVERVGAVLVYHDSASSTTQTRFEVHTFERRETELAQGFSEIGSGSGDLTRTWDWTTVPTPLAQSVSPESTTLVALHPLPAFFSHTLALVVLSQPTGFSLAHIDLSANAWTVVGEPIDLGELKGEVEFELVVSEAVERGQLGLAALVGKETGATLVVVPRLEGQPILGDAAGAESPNATDAATAIILAERQEVDWSDVIRAACGSTGVGKQKELISAMTERVYALALDESHADELELVLRVQIALFSSMNDTRLDLASDILRLNVASNLVDRCAVFAEDGKISFDLDSIWPLLNVMEWATGLIARALRETILHGARMEWASDEASAELEQPTLIILIAHPTLRSLVLRLLSQLAQLTSFLQTLELPILQPESRSVPAPIKRDPMATIVARDRIKDVAYTQGFDVFDSGKELELVSSKDVSEGDIRTSLLELSLSPIREHLKVLCSALSAPSTLFLSSTQSEMSAEQSYDGITFQPLSAPAHTGKLLVPTGNGGTVKCARCGWATEHLPGGGGMVNIGAAVDSPWNEWKKQWEKGCVCGGTWGKATRERR